VYAPQVIGTRRDAERALAALLDTVAGCRAGGVDGVHPAMTVNELWAQFEQLVMPTLSPGTRAGYRSKWRSYVRPAIGDLRVEQLTALHLERLYADVQRRDLSTWTCRHVHTIVSSVLTSAARWGVCPTMHAAKQAKAPR